MVGEEEPGGQGRRRDMALPPADGRRGRGGRIAARDGDANMPWTIHVGPRGTTGRGTNRRCHRSRSTAIGPESAPTVIQRPAAEGPPSLRRPRRRTHTSQNEEKYAWIRGSAEVDQADPATIGGKTRKVCHTALVGTIAAIGKGWGHASAPSLNI